MAHIGIAINKDTVEIFTILENGSVDNGIRFDTLGNMFIVDNVNHNVLWVKAGERVATVYSHNKHMK